MFLRTPLAPPVKLVFEGWLLQGEHGSEARQNTHRRGKEGQAGRKMAGGRNVRRAQTEIAMMLTIVFLIH